MDRVAVVVVVENHTENALFPVVPRLIHPFPKPQAFEAHLLISLDQTAEKNQVFTLLLNHLLNSKAFT